MDEYINLQTAKENIVSLTIYNGEEEIRQAVKSARHKEDQWIGGIHDALISLSEIPAADVKPVVRGKWKQSDFVPGMLTCTNCGAQRNPNFKIGCGAWHFCPNCGADMRRADND